MTEGREIFQLRQFRKIRSERKVHTSEKPSLGSHIEKRTLILGGFRIILVIICNWFFTFTSLLLLRLRIAPFGSDSSVGGDYDIFTSESTSIYIVFFS